jgi:PAS domain-containing protein
MMMLTAEKLRFYQKVFDDAPVAYAIMELQLGEHQKPQDIIFRYVNQAFASMYKFTVAEFLGKTYNRVMHKETSWLQTFAVTATTGKATHFSLLLQEHNLYVHVDCYQLEPGLCGCLVTDISAEGNMSQQLLMEAGKF